MKHGRTKLQRKTIRLSLLVVVFLGLNISVASAHNWWYWCWHTGSTINVRVFGSYQSEALAALFDWDTHTDVNFNRVTSHTELSVYGANWGAVSWDGLATIVDSSYDWWHHWRYCEIDHAHATYNTYRSGSHSNHDIHGIFCQEIGHTLGLDHSDDGCMGKGYFNNLNHTVPHNWRDINSKF